MPESISVEKIKAAIQSGQFLLKYVTVYLQSVQREGAP